MTAQGISFVDNVWFRPRHRHTIPFIVVLFALFVCIFAGIPLPAFLPYPWLRLLHFIGGIMLIGSAINTSVREAFTLSLKSRPFTYYVYKWAGLADLFLFYPGAFCIAFAGASMTSMLYGNIYAANWLFAANIAFFLSLLSYMVMSYSQFSVASYMRREVWSESFSEHEEAYLRRAIRREWALNIVCAIFTFYPIILMVLKPELHFVTELRIAVAALFGISAT